MTVRTGADLTFIPEGFHTFTVLPAGGNAKADWKTNGVGVDDTDDSTLNVNGTTRSEFNLPALAPTCGPTPLPACDFGGSSVINISPFGPPGPVNVHVSADPGTYIFVCRIHAGMSGTLKVVPANAKVPSQAQVDKSVAKQVKHDLDGAWAGRQEGQPRRGQAEQGWVADAARHGRDVEQGREGRPARVLPEGP